MEKGIGAALAALAVFTALSVRLLLPGFADEAKRRVIDVFGLSYGAEAIEAMGERLLSNGVYGAVAEVFSGHSGELWEVSHINDTRLVNSAP